MTIESSPQPHYPVDEITLRAYVERMIADQGVLIRQKSEDREKLAAQRWDDHDIVHRNERTEVDKALTRTDGAILSALEAHRREHSIAEAAQTKADHTHQVQHQALNELRDVVGDLTSRYVPLSSLQNITDGWERRWTDRQKDFDNYREGIAKEQAAYREAVRIEIQHLRDARAQSEGRGVGSSAAVAYVLAGIGLLIGVVGLAARFVTP